MRRGLFFSIPLLLLLPVVLFAQSADDLRNQIKDHSDQISKLDAEIAQYEKDLKNLGSKKSSLQNTISQLDISKKKLGAEISKLNNSISSTELEIKELDNGIQKTSSTIDTTRSALSETLRSMQEFDNVSFVSTVIASDVVKATWDSVNRLEQVQGAIGDHITLLKDEKTTLQTNKDTKEDKRASLLSQQKQLNETKGAVEATRSAQSDLLKQTKSTESEYQSLLKKKQAAKQQFEDALNDLEAKLKVAIDPSQILAGGKGILRYPVDNVRVSQNFGNTSFSLAGGYNGKGHNGIDLAVPIGTPVRAAGSGTVIGTGNTDLVNGCYSYGKWVMVKHNNGLSTIIAHLSKINVSEGQSLARGELLGYSGMTGYATGPHVHFGVYVSSATQIIKLGAATNKVTPCANAVMPVAPLGAYLNPMNYL